MVTGVGKRAGNSKKNALNAGISAVLPQEIPQTSGGTGEKIGKRGRKGPIRQMVYLPLHNNSSQSTSSIQESTSPKEVGGSGPSGKIKKAKGKQQARPKEAATYVQEGPLYSSRELRPDVSGKGGVTTVNVLTPKNVVSGANKKLKMPGSLFTPTTPFAVENPQQKPVSSEPSSLSYASTSELPTEKFEELVQETRDSLLDDQCLLRDLLLDLQDKQRELGGFLTDVSGKFDLILGKIGALETRVEDKNALLRVHHNLFMEV